MKIRLRGRNFTGHLQQLGRALIFPMIVLPGAALMLSLASLPWADWGLATIPGTLHFAANGVFELLPYLFALGVALGMTNNAASAGISAIVGLWIYSSLIELADNVGPSVLTGIVVGWLTYFVHERLQGVQFHESIQFFGGPRFVPIVVSLIAVFAGFLMMGLTPMIRQALIELAQSLDGHMGLLVFLFGVIFRLLVVIGLHHIVGHVFYFQYGSYTVQDGFIIQGSQITAQSLTVTGDLPRYLAGDVTAGYFMAGLYPMTMFAIPAIALAMIHTAQNRLKPSTKKSLRVSSWSSILTGVTEQIEFAFLFVAPRLFAFHAFMSGAMMWIVYELGIRHGFTYSSGLIDFLINLHLASDNWWLLLPLGFIMGVIYYFVFRFAIIRYNIPTPGREGGTNLANWAADIPYRAPLIVQALGGKDNLNTIEACITRLRLNVIDSRLINRAQLKSLGAAGMISLGQGNVQVVFGTYSELIAKQINQLIRRDQPRIQFVAPMQGAMIPLTDVPDRVFAEKVVGEGVAFVPDIGRLVSPVQGKIIHIFPSLHAYGIRTAEGLEVLLHIGLNTSELNGKGFEQRCALGDIVQPGQTIAMFDLDVLHVNERTTISTMIITNPELVEQWSFAPMGEVKIGKTPVLTVVLSGLEGIHSKEQSNGREALS